MKILSYGKVAVSAALVAGAIVSGTAFAGQSLYDAFGQKAGITSLINTFVGNVAADNRINYYFAHTDIPHLKMELVNQVCAGVGGPCTYTGRSMKSTHAGMGVTDSAFNALTEDMIAAMNYHHVPLWAQNKLIAVLAPMKYQIVTK